MIKISAKQLLTTIMSPKLSTYFIVVFFEVRERVERLCMRIHLCTHYPFYNFCSSKIRYAPQIHGSEH